MSNNSFQLCIPPKLLDIFSKIVGFSQNEGQKAEGFLLTLFLIFCVLFEERDTSNACNGVTLLDIC